MKNKEKKVIILDNLSSPFISQAIIILKENTTYEQNTILEEAEKIVADFFPKSKKNPTKKNNKLFWAGLVFTTIIVGLLIRLL